MIDSITHFDGLFTWPHLDAGIFCLRPPGSKLGPLRQKDAHLTYTAERDFGAASRASVP